MRGTEGEEVKNEVELRLPSLPENVALARLLVAGLAGQLPFTLQEMEEIKVAVSEAVTNCVVHAYPDRPGPVQVTGRVRDGVLEVEVEDWGRGMEDVEKAREPSYSTLPDHLGLGFAFMENFMDGVEVWSEPGRGTRVRMWKKSSK